jgi:hypothetical protein
MKTEDICEFLDAGRRAYRLRRSVRECPNFDNAVYVRAWKAGYYSARDRVSLEAAVQTFLGELDR